VLQKQAGDALLDTYEAERRHVAIVNSMQSVKNGKKIFQLLKILGLGDDVVTARQNLYASLKDPAKVKLIDEGVEDQREHFDNVWTKQLNSACYETVLTRPPARTPHRLRLRQQRDPTARLQIHAEIPGRRETAARLDPAGTTHASVSRRLVRRRIHPRGDRVPAVQHA
jgi:hypothetical protein